MSFERFIGRGKPTASPKVTILANGLIEFSEGATRKFALNRFNYVVLYYNEEENQVGIQFTK